MKHWLGLWFGIALFSLTACRQAAPRPEPPRLEVDERPLSALAVDPEPWLPFESNSDQRQPVYLGGRPVELLKIAQAGPPSDARVELPASLGKLGEAQALALARHLPPTPDLELEAWPAEDDYGWQLTWAWARWRPSPEAGAAGPWTWLRQADLPEAEQPDRERPALLPRELDPLREPDRLSLFGDLLELGLYDRPAFGECVWVERASGRLLAGWLDLGRREAYAQTLRDGAAPAQLCQALRQPARLAGRPLSFVVHVRDGQILWPESIEWLPDSPPSLVPEAGNPCIRAWPEDFAKQFLLNIVQLDGEEEAVFPLSGRRERFERKNSIQADHQLEDVADYLAERYRELGLDTRRQSFEWRGLRQSNLIAVVPGSEGARLPPVILADHYDTAFSETVFKQEGARRSVPGADDNASATSALLLAGRLLPALAPRHDVWLVHLTGEEYPGDDLGARALLTEWLTARQSIAGLLILDMIAYQPANAKRPLFQINAGDSPESLRLAQTALGAAEAVAPELKAALRTRFNPKSYLYNTDGHVFSQAGYPVLLLNEHINALENLDRPHYHEMTDTSDTLDIEYGAAVARVALETAARLAEARCP